MAVDLGKLASAANSNNIILVRDNGITNKLYYTSRNSSGQTQLLTQESASARRKSEVLAIAQGAADAEIRSILLGSPLSEGFTIQNSVIIGPTFNNDLIDATALGTATSIGQCSVAIGASSVSLDRSVAIGANSQALNNSISIGAGADQGCSEFAIAITPTQYSLLNSDNNSEGVYIGSGLSSSTNNQRGILLGHNSGGCNNYQGTIIGYIVRPCNNVAGVAVASFTSNTNNESGVMLGNLVASGGSDNSYGVAIGDTAAASYTNYEGVANNNYGIAIGYCTAVHANNNYGIAIGYRANPLSDNQYGVTIGQYAGSSNNVYGVIVGSCSGGINTHQGVIVGSCSGGSSTYQGVVIGYCAGNCTSSFSVVIGQCAGYGNNYNSVIVGRQSGNDPRGCNYYSTFIGNAATGNCNAVAVGYGSTAGPSGVSIGQAAGATTNSYNNLRCTFIGNSSGGYPYNNIVNQNNTAIGANAQNDTLTNQIMLGDTNITSLKCKVSLTTTSDIRDKTDIESLDNNNMYNIVKNLTPIKFRGNDRSYYKYDERKSNPEVDAYGISRLDYDTELHRQGTKKEPNIQVGFSAQEVETVLEQYASDLIDIVNDTARWNKLQGMKDIDLIKVNNPEVESRKSLQYEKFVPILVGAIQVLQNKVESLEAQLIN